MIFFSFFLTNKIEYTVMERTNVFGNLMVYIQLVKSKLLISFIVPIISLLDSRALSQIAIFAFLDLTEESNDIFFKLFNIYL